MKKARKKTLTALHVASFAGNSGDHLNHSGFYPWFSELCGASEVLWNRLEIRDVWRSDRDLFARLQAAAPGLDIIVFGGGNFWETWDSSSLSGTSLNVTYEQLKSLGVPVFFNSLGLETVRGVSHNALTRFVDDVAAMMSDDRFFVTVRNDGASKNLSDLGYDLPSSAVLPDHGIFTELDDILPAISGEPTVTINLAVDMPEIRFRGFRSPDHFFDLFANFLESSASVVPFTAKFVAHVPSDVWAFNKLASALSEEFMRTKLSLFWYGGRFDKDLAFHRHYLTARASIVQRFHANVVGLRSHGSLMSVSNHPQVIDFHREFATAAANICPLESPSDFERLASLLLAEITGAGTDTVASHAEQFEAATEQRNSVGSNLRSWLVRQVIG